MKLGDQLREEKQKKDAKAKKAARIANERRAAYVAETAPKLAEPIINGLPAEIRAEAKKGWTSLVVTVRDPEHGYSMTFNDMEKAMAWEIIKWAQSEGIDAHTRPATRDMDGWSDDEAVVLRWD